MSSPRTCPLVETVLALAALAGSALGQQASRAPAAAEPGEIQWRSGISRAVVGPEMSAAQRLVELDQRAERHVIVQLDRPVDEATRAELARGGVALLSYLGENAFFAALADQGVDQVALEAVGSLRRAEGIRLEHKLSPLFAGGPPQHALIGVDPQGNVRIAAYVVFHPDVPLEDGQELVRQLGVTAIDTVSLVNALVVELPLAVLPALATAQAHEEGDTRATQHPSADHSGGDPGGRGRLGPSLRDRE